MRIEEIKKRSGRIVPFDRTRVERAIEKAFIATSTPYKLEDIVTLTDEVIESLSKIYTENLVPEVEKVQDIVEERLLVNGYISVAKAYIIYRKEHEAIRKKEEEFILQKIQDSSLKVKKRDGSFVNFNIKEIEDLISLCARDYGSVIDIQGILEDTKRNIYDGITTKDINQAILLSIKSRMELDPAYSSFASRFLCNDVYKEVLNINEFNLDFNKKYINDFAKQIIQGVSSGRLDKRLLDFDLHKLSLSLDYHRDRLFEYLGMQVVYDRYFLRDHDQKILECPQYFFMRVAMGMSILENDKEEKAIEFYNCISTFRYLPSTPTLLHSGTISPQMSSCYITTVEDKLAHIFKSIGDNAQLAKWSGGVANDWTNVRATNALIKSINVRSQGVIPFLKITDSTTAAINRSGKRRGATCVYLEPWHYDYEEFLDLRRNTGDDRRRTHDTNTASWIPDLFMQRVLSDSDWTLFSPEEVKDLHHIYGSKFKEAYELYEKKAELGGIKLFKKVKAKDLWRKMITMLYETGHPWITFKDPCNIRSPQDHVGVIHSSNLCTEITLNTSEEETAVCNLGSICISRHIKDRKLDYELLKSTVKVAMRMLDNIIDINFYPTSEGKYSNLRHRPVGLGVMGFHDALCLLGLNFDSTEAVELSDELMENISYNAILSSSELAKERGSYSTFKGSKWDRGILPIDTIALLEKERGELIDVNRKNRLNWEVVRDSIKRNGMRNSNCMAIAPTATIANISGCMPSIEPAYKNLYVKSNFSGEFTVVNEYLVNDLKNLNIWNKDIIDKIKYFDGSIQKINEIPLDIRLKYKEAFEIDPYWVIAHAAYRGKWIDQSQSINLFIVSQSGKVISDVYINAWRMGLKTTYYLRSLGASSVEKSTLDINKNYHKENDLGEVVTSEDGDIKKESHEEIKIDVFSYENPKNHQKEEVVIIEDTIQKGSATKTNIHIFEAGICESCQ